jgi:aspartyl-tRNA(Asn)/glutamyl-tRNA(Gln) amidotransferase subunit B
LQGQGLNRVRDIVTRIRDFEPVIGLEVHAQLLTDSKLFCTCATGFGEAANTRTCPTCLGLPGALPVLNRRAVDLAARTIAAVNGTINSRSEFARKNYFYPDLPKGYQISQYDQPLGEGGEIHYATDDGAGHSCRLLRIHLEEDAGKSLHPEHGEADTRVDFNRCGTPLLEIVTAPEIPSPEHAQAYLLKLKQVLQYLDVCSGDMEKGHLRCDANISVRRRGESELGTRTEVKNMNSFRAVRRALESEFERQAEILARGDRIEQATMLWDENRQVAEPMRTKEESPDYRYFPEPDLPPIELTPEEIARIRDSLPEMPDRRRDRFMEQFGVREYDAVLLTDARDMADYFEAVMRLFDDGRTAANFVLSELMGYLKESGIKITDPRVAPEHVAAVLAAVRDGEISGPTAKRVLREMAESGRPPMEIVDSLGLRQISDEVELTRVTERVISDHPVQAGQYRAGEKKLLGYFVGLVMKETAGRANPRVVNKLLKDKLNG